MARRDFAGLERRRMRAVRLFEEGETQATIVFIDESGSSERP
jgi:hypothetical protein